MKLSQDAAFAGFRLGLLIGALVALFKAPRIRVKGMQRQIADASKEIRDKIENTVASDPMSESIAQGKEAARRRRAELGRKP